jgi:hypothetical protein
MEGYNVCSNDRAGHDRQAAELRVKISVLCGQIIDSAQNSGGCTGFSPLARSIGEAARLNLS